jgi:hypothetical protein
MVTISISVAAYRAIAGRLPVCRATHDRGDRAAILVDHKTLDRLTAGRGPTESYSDVIFRLAKGEGGEE